MPGKIKPLDWGEWTGAVVRIYRNLNNGTMSIQTKQGKSWKVAGHVTDAVVRNVAFKIQDGGRLRVIRDGRKNVHAWGQGVLVGQADDIYCPISLSYDPFSDRSFVHRDSGVAIERADWLVVRDNLVFVSPDAVGGAPDNVIALPQTHRQGRVVQVDFAENVSNWRVA